LSNRLHCVPERGGRCIEHEIPGSVWTIEDPKCYNAIPGGKPTRERMMIEHALDPAVTLRVITSPLDGWIVAVEGWTAPPHLRRAHADIESAQRAADDVLINYKPHDCKQCGCGEWVPIVGVREKNRPTTSH
jgi:hypothetical protein